jgi:hypothetical protein
VIAYRKRKEARTLKRILELQQEEIRLTKALQKVEEAERRIWQDSGVRDLMEQALAYWEDEPIGLDQFDQS